MAAGIRSSICRRTRPFIRHECMHIKWNDPDGGTLEPQDFITLNVSGMKFETLRSTLERFPKTLLGNEDQRRPYFVVSKNAYYFNRCRQSFEAVLYYYQSGGILKRPLSVPMLVFEKEILFYELGEDLIKKLQKAEEQFIVYEPAAKEENETNNGDVLARKTIKEQLWDLFEHPDSNSAARVVSFLSMFIIGISITVFCLETLPVFKKPRGNKSNTTAPLTNSTEEKHALFRQVAYCFHGMEMCCVIWFVLEYFIRLLSSPCKLRFLFSFLNTIDLLAILPYFIGLWIRTDGNATPLSVLRGVRLVRVFRIFKLSRHSLSLQVLGNTLKASVREMAMLIFFLAVGVLVFSSALYYAEYAESGPDGDFSSIPDTFWYTLVTMTTIGYGDVVPTTLVGKLIGSLCTLTGVLTLALPVPVIVSNFQYFYKRETVVHQRKKARDEEDEEMKSDIPYNGDV